MSIAPSDRRRIRELDNERQPDGKNKICEQIQIICYIVIAMVNG